MQAKRIEYVRNYKKTGNREQAYKALKDLYGRTKNHADEDLVLPMLEAVEARATLQEVCDVMREAVGFSMPQ